MYTRQSRKVIWDMINALFLTTVAVEPTFVSFHWPSRTYVRGLSRHSFKFLWRTGQTKTTQNTFRDYRVHFFGQPFSKQLLVCRDAFPFCIFRKISSLSVSGNIFAFILFSLSRNLAISSSDNLQKLVAI